MFCRPLLLVYVKSLSFYAQYPIYFLIKNLELLFLILSPKRQINRRLDQKESHQIAAGVLVVSILLEGGLLNAVLHLICHGRFAGFEHSGNTKQQHIPTGFCGDNTIPYPGDQTIRMLFPVFPG